MMSAPFKYMVQQVIFCTCGEQFRYERQVSEGEGLYHPELPTGWRLIDDISHCMRCSAKKLRRKAKEKRLELKNAPESDQFKLFEEISELERSASEAEVEVGKADAAIADADKRHEAAVEADRKRSH